MKTEKVDENTTKAYVVYDLSPPHTIRGSGETFDDALLDYLQSYYTPSDWGFETWKKVLETWSDDSDQTTGIMTRSEYQREYED